MSRQAQAEREKQARVILGSEAEIAGKFVEAVKIYTDHPAALQLRAMNIIYKTAKERGTTILIPTSMGDNMNPALALVRRPKGSRRGHPVAEELKRRWSLAGPGLGDALECRAAGRGVLGRDRRVRGGGRVSRRVFQRLLRERPTLEERLASAHRHQPSALFLRRQRS
jgi:hypothetical protein